MSNPVRVLATVVLVLVLLPLPGRGQSASSFATPSLAGVESVDARILLSFDDELALNQATLRQRLSTVFELTLRQYDIGVSESAPNYLTVSFVVLDSGNGLVAYAYRIELTEPMVPARGVDAALLETILSIRDQPLDTMRMVGTPGDSLVQAALAKSRYWEVFLKSWTDHQAMWGPTWSGGAGVVTVGSARLKEALEKSVRELAEEFVNDYKKAGH